MFRRSKNSHGKKLSKAICSSVIFECLRRIFILFLIAKLFTHAKRVFLSSSLYLVCSLKLLTEKVDVMFCSCVSFKNKQPIFLPTYFGIRWRRTFCPLLPTNSLSSELTRLKFCLVDVCSFQAMPLIALDFLEFDSAKNWNYR